jgi:hypothetical protein
LSKDLSLSKGPIILSPSKDLSLSKGPIILSPSKDLSLSKGPIILSPSKDLSLSKGLLASNQASTGSARTEFFSARTEVCPFALSLSKGQAAANGCALDPFFATTSSAVGEPATARLIDSLTAR